MGAVYRATQLSLNRVVALKLLAPNLGDDAGFRARFEREGHVQAALDHDHIVPVYEAGQSEHGLFLAMRLISGPTLKQLILDNSLDPRRSVRLLAQVAHALDSAHQAGLIHRDIKPQNILVGKGDHAFLADFGLIKAPEEARLTGTGQFIGTIDYVAPEQIQGEPATPASDTYALAAVLYECLTGEVPFPKPSEAATLHAHVMSPPPVVSERRPDLPRALDGVIQHGMAKDPWGRPAAAVELIQAASRALSSSPTSPAPGAGRGGTAGARDRARVQTTKVPAVGATADSAPPASAPAAASDPRVLTPAELTREVDRPHLAPVAEPPPRSPATPDPVASPPALEPEPDPVAVTSITDARADQLPRYLIAVVAALVVAAFVAGLVVGLIIS